MSDVIEGAGIDRVLRDAVDAGAVPHVAAIAADRDSVIYEGGVGPRSVVPAGLAITRSAGRNLRSSLPTTVAVSAYLWPLFLTCITGGMRAVL